MKVGDIFNYLNTLAPEGYAEEWDNVGLMVGSRTWDTKKILLCLDVTGEVIEEALREKAELIISHHPFLFSKLSRFDADTIKGSQINTLIKNNISVISAHTNLDVAEGGVNDKLAEVLGLIECKNLKSYIPSGFDVDLGMGKAGVLPSETVFKDFVGGVKKKLGIKNLRIVGPQPENVKTVAVFCGSFDGDLNSIKKAKADVLVTGDLKYHTAMDARELGLCIVDVGHFASEKVILGKLKKLLDDRFDSIETICSKVEQDPFIFA